MDTVRIRLMLQDAAKFYAEAKLAAKGIDDIGDKTEKADRKAKRAAVSLNLVQRTIRLIKPAALIAGLGYLTQILSGAAAAAIGLTSAVAPLGGLLAGIPALAVGAGQGLGVLALGFNGVAGAVGGLNDAMDVKKLAALPPAARAFAGELNRAKSPLLDLQRAVQGGMFPGLTAGLRSAMRATSVLNGPLAQTGRIFGDFGRRLGLLVGSSGFLADLGSQAKFNNRQFTALSGAGLHVVNLLRNLTVAARPLVAWIVRLVSGWAASADRAVSLGRATGGLARMFESVRVTTMQVGRLLASLTVTLFNIGRVGKRELGDSLLDSLVKGSRALRDWSSSATGVRQITTYFRDAKPVVYAVGRLLRDASLAFLSFGAGGTGTAALIDQLRTQLLPLMVQLTQHITQTFGPHLIDAITSVGRAFAPIAGASGPLVLFLDMVRRLADAIVWVQRHVPGATQAFTLLFGAIAVTKAIGFASFTSQLFGFGRGLKQVGAVIKVFSNTTIGIRLGLMALAVAEGVATVATGALGIALAVLTSPITLIIVGIAAVAAGFYFAYTRIGWFHDAVNAVVNWVKGHWPLLLSILTGPFGAAVIYIVRHFNQVVDFVKGLPGRIANAASGMWDGLKHGLVAAINWIIAKWNWLSDHAKAPSWVPGIGGHHILPTIAPLQGAADGGIVRTAGAFLVGERGPELFTMMPGLGAARVDPLPVPQQQMPRLARAGAQGGQSAGPIYLNVRSVVTLPDGQVLGEATNLAVAREDARA